jgi:hypothetical protein
MLSLPSSVLERASAVPVSTDTSVVISLSSLMYESQFCSDPLHNQIMSAL